MSAGPSPKQRNANRVLAGNFWLTVIRHVRGKANVAYGVRVMSAMEYCSVVSPAAVLVGLYRPAP